MRPLTDLTPKPLLRLGKEALIEYHLNALRKGGFNDIVINIAYLAEQIRNAVGDGHKYGLTIHYSDESGHALETGGGIFKALPILGPDPFLVVNGDIWCDYPLDQKKIINHDLAYLILVDNPEHNRKGDFSLCNGRLRASVLPKLTFSGIGYYRPELFNGCVDGKFKLAPLLLKAISQDLVGGEHYSGRWYDIGTPSRLSELNKLLTCEL
jgi:MurNAc alpha-1-phosphate uridylyltransferase